jgi:hypothetical protein
LADWNVIRLSEGKKPINIGIGLNTDVVVSGNIGAKKRMDYTIIGDGVNLAARLESACKQYAAKILISEFTQKKLRGTYRMREIDLVVVKGKTQPVAVFEVLDYHTEQTFPNLMDVVSHTKFLKYPDQDAVKARVRRWLQTAPIPLGELLFAFEILYHLKSWGSGKFEARDFLKRASKKNPPPPTSENS